MTASSVEAGVKSPEEKGGCDSVWLRLYPSTGGLTWEARNRNQERQGEAVVVIYRKATAPDTIEH